MKPRHWLFALVLLFPVAVYANDPPQDPYDAVKQATDQLLARLVEVQPIYKTDPKKFYAEIQKSLSPFIDFEGFAKGVMAKYYRRADAKQREAFAEKFQQELIHTYANSLVKFNNEKVEVEPLAEPPDDGSATVDLKIYSNDGTVYPVEYSLRLIDGKWKLRNVVINGINIGLQFRSQFANYMQKYNNDIDKVIANWDVNG